MKNNPLPRLDTFPELRDRILPHCRLKAGQIWQDPDGKHQVGWLDATDAEAIERFVGGLAPTLAIQDPPYNLVAFARRSIEEYIEWSRRWVQNCHAVLSPDASLYVWLGADQN